MRPQFSANSIAHLDRGIGFEVAAFVDALLVVDIDRQVSTAFGIERTEDVPAVFVDRRRCSVPDVVGAKRRELAACVGREEQPGAVRREVLGRVVDIALMRGDVPR